MIRSKLILAICVALGFSQSIAQDEHPAFGNTQSAQLTVDAEVPDIPKLEAKAVDILRTKYGLTLDEARAKVRIDGKTDVARCLEYVVINALAGITQANVIGSTIVLQHPTEPVEQP